MKVRRVEEADFRKLDGVRQVVMNEYPHQFGILDLGELGYYGLAWRGEYITPVVEVSSDRQNLWLAVDQRLAVVDLQDGHLCLVLPLADNVFQILIQDEVVAVLTELEVILFNSDCSIRCICGLPDLAEEISYLNSVFVVRSLDGPVLTLDPRTGVMTELIQSLQTK